MFGKFHAVIAGLACGDALGRPTEFMHMPEIRARYGSQGITDLSQTTKQFTDDAQMTIALAKGLLDAKLELCASTADLSVIRERLADPTFVMPRVAKRFAEWSVSPQNNRAPGTTCMGACRRLVAGVPWTEAGIVGSKGCGAAMRVASIGLLYSDRTALGRIARASALSTHNHPVAAQAAHIAALTVRMLLDGVKPDYLLSELVSTVRAAGGLDDSFAELLGRIDGAVISASLGTWKPEEIQVDEDTHHQALGEAWKADSAVACALFCFLLAVRRREGYVETVRYGANTDGDSDSIACIAGSFAGAYWGLHEDRKGVPGEWVCTIEDAKSLADLAIALYGAHLVNNPGPLDAAIEARRVGAGNDTLKE